MVKWAEEYERQRRESRGGWIPDSLVFAVMYDTRAGSELDCRANLDAAFLHLGLSHDEVIRRAAEFGR